MRALLRWLNRRPFVQGFLDGLAMPGEFLIRWLWCSWRGHSERRIGKREGAALLTTGAYDEGMIRALRICRLCGARRLAKQRARKGKEAQC